jgi:putative AbiEii toxin of type IV toxin-antitoxin system
VGYGATRRVERKERLDFAARQSSAFVRAQRVQSLFEEAYSLIPMNVWLPQFKDWNPGRYKQVVNLVNRLIGKGHYEFTGEMEGEEFVFERRGLKVPFSALSDGYRAFLGWVGDLLYHVCMTCPSGKKLVDNRGIVMVDEIDLHLHPTWQMTVLPTIAQELPNIQFIVTSHSPLIVGSLEWMNIILMVPAPRQASQPKRIEWAVHGLDADQILLTDFFGLKSTRAEGKKRALKAREGDADAAKQLLDEMSRGLEESRHEDRAR